MRCYSAVVAVCLVLAVAATAGATNFNGAADNQTDASGYYYIITGGLFPTGATPNGSSASGGTFRYLTDDPAWGSPIDAWQKDGWFADNAGLALTMVNRETHSIVYDNNGIDAGTYGDYYTAGGSHGDHGLRSGYSMSNNRDWIYAGYFKLEQETTFTGIAGYFDGNGSTGDPPFDPFSSSVRYRMNIWSNVAGDLLPVNTGNFTGDVFSTDSSAGVFVVNDTDQFRVMPDNSTDPIYRVGFNLYQSVTLPAGEYWFSHDAIVVPEPLTMAGLMLGIGGLVTYVRKRRKA